MGFYLVNIVSELGEELSITLLDMDEYSAEEQARRMVENGELECFGRVAVSVYAFSID